MLPVAAPFVSLLTDFGVADPSVAACKGVILRINPDVRLIDISHGVARHCVAHGAAILWAALPYLPAGIHLAVVDPGVGTERRAIALRTGRGDHLVGPDNGLLLPAAERLGGIVAAHLLENRAYRLAPVSRTFHARDIFAPAAAHLSRGVALDAFGAALDPASLVRLETPAPAYSPGHLDASVAFVDTWGNVQLLAEPADLETAIGRVSNGDELRVEAADGSSLGGVDGIDLHWRLTYGDAEPGEPLVFLDSYGRLALAVNLQSAAERYGLEADRRVRISRR
ncbi:MAG: SAM-dependent chlorinase/fluorinase [Candidatus Limnocylindrales bacterium]|jgi:S-adenosylmethionine hydrolase